MCICHVHLRLCPEFFCHLERSREIWSRRILGLYWKPDFPSGLCASLSVSATARRWRASGRNDTPLARYEMRVTRNGLKGFGQDLSCGVAEVG
jgi:hypothetical protein